mgnify:CR=1 FL=1
MGKISENLSSVHHASFGRLHEITSNYNQATLLDKLIFWWQISNYTLEDGNKWFTRSITQIAEESRLSERSVGRYLKLFSDAGYIEKTTRLYRKKNLYIRVTDKLLSLIGGQGINPTDGREKGYSDIDKKNSTPKTECLFTGHIGMTGSANLAVSIYKEQDCNILNNNTVSETSTVNFEDNPLQPHETKEALVGEPCTNPAKYPTYAIEKQIGERLPETTKNYIKGTMKNLKKQHQIAFSNPEQVFSEVVFSLLNVDKQFPGISDMHHRMNLIAKLMREKRWCTPKGFYKYWDIGQLYQQKQEKQASIDRAQKHRESGGGTLYPSKQDAALRWQSSCHVDQQTYTALQGLIATETRYLYSMEERFKRNPDPVTKRVIESTAIKLSQLHDKIQVLEASFQAKAA